MRDVRFSGHPGGFGLAMPPFCPVSSHGIAIAMNGTPACDSGIPAGRVDNLADSTFDCVDFIAEEP